MTDFDQFYKLKVTKTINDNSTSSNFVGESENIGGRNATTFSVGDEITIFADIGATPPTTKIFTGIVEDIDFDGTETRERLTISGRDYTARLMDVTVEPEVYTNLPAGSIVKDIVNKYVSDITFTNVDDSDTTIERISFNHTPVYDAIQKLAELSGYRFYVDVDKDLHFKEKATVSSNLTFDSGNTTFAEFSEERDSVFNEVWVYGDRYLDNFQETFTAGSPAGGSVFTLLYKPHNTEITSSGAIQVGGIEGMNLIPNSGTNYLVDFHDKEIIFVSGTTLGYSSIPTSGTQVVVKYDRSLPIVKVGRRQSSIDAYGKRVLKITDKEIKDPDEAVRLVNQKLDDLSNPRKEGSLDLKNVLNVTPGETCIVNFPWQNVNSQTYEIIEANYKFDKRNILTNQSLSIKVNKKLNDAGDKLKDFETRIRKLESQDIDPSDILTRLEYTTGSIGIRASGVIVYSNTATGSVAYLYSTNFTPPTFPFKLASGTGQGIIAGSFTGSASAYGPFQINWSGGYPT